MTRLEVSEATEGEMLASLLAGDDAHVTHRDDGQDPIALGNILDHRAVLAYVTSRRTPDGGYSYYRTPEWGVEEPNSPDTLAALSVLELLGVEPPERRVTRDWLRGLQDDVGGYPSLAIGWGALRALALLGASPRMSPVTWLGRVAMPDIGSRRPRYWRGTLVSLLRVLELSRLYNLDLRTRATRVSRVLADARDASGAWARPGPDLASSATAVAITRLCGLDLERPDLLADFVHQCEDDALGLRMTPSGRSTSVDAIWGGLEVLWQLGRPATYRAAIATNLALLQRPDGGIGGRHRALSTLEATWRAMRAEDLIVSAEEDPL